ncbi:uncharacterized protein LOC131873659 isoform X1 [Cryptomeria japonica]|uniref:uncharacterized protein LOC131873659 isoform X1 n=1 Tax=Cryptomeria japonica TaxID=3369 RepID=UPI0027DA7EF5|nr:uncharacterized protein LOC131873659 isoform X1 [Cryptomeria japonica]
MGVGVRTLTVLKQFEPFGLNIEASDNGDGKPFDGEYKYSLFDSQLIRSNEDIISASCNDCDHELFIRGKHLVWSSSSQVLRRYSAPSTIIKVASSSTSERNWSTYSFIHSVKRNRLLSKRAENLVYVHSNLRLLSHKQRDYTQGETKMWDIELEHIDLDAPASSLLAL